MGRTFECKVLLVETDGVDTATYAQLADGAIHRVHVASVGSKADAFGDVTVSGRIV